jgi:hypothetical protein
MKASPLGFHVTKKSLKSTSGWPGYERFSAECLALPLMQFF